MAWVPVIVANKRNRYHRSKAGGAIIAAVILSLLLGIFFLVFFNNFRGITVFPLWIFISGFGGFIIIIVIIAAIASAMSSSTQKVKEEHMRHMNSIERQEQALLENPYMVRKEVKKDVPIIAEIHYCRYCGEKVDRDAKFCHQCGIKL